MSEQFEYIDALIAKVLSAEATAEETRELTTWRNAATENEEYFGFSEKLFAAIDAEPAGFDVNTDAAWAKLDARISTETQVRTETKVIPLFKRIKPLRIAASVALLIVLGFVVNLLLIPKAIEPTVLAANTKTVEQHLPDGSKVFLNKHSQITYVKNKDNVREVKLKGEAFFEVVHDEKQPFVITVDDIIIKDIGTAFNVKAIPGTPVVEVSVESGEVQFFTKANAGVTLVKGETATYDRLGGTFSKHAVTPQENTSSYRTKLFTFKETPLKDVLRQINAVYDSDIRLADKSLENCKLSVMFTDEDLEMIVMIICETLDLQTERSGNTIILKGAACAE